MSTLDPSAFAELAAQLHSESEDEDVTAHSIVVRAAEVVSEADHVSITIATARGGYATLASTSDLATTADALQYEMDEGPCLEVVETASWFRSGDVASDPRWTRWGPAASGLGLGSVLAVRLITSDATSDGALNFYSATIGAFFDTETIDLAQVYAVHGANALSSARMVTGLRTALTSRHAIGMAQGMLMERYRIDQQRSFELLRRTSSVHNIKVRDLATSVIETGNLPGSPRVVTQPQHNSVETRPE